MLSPLKRIYMKYQFRARGPWITRYYLNGEPFGGTRDYSDHVTDPRIPWFHQHFPKAKRILELGSLEGGHSFELARLPDVEKVVGIEGRQYNVDRANFARRLLKLRNVEFITANIETLDFTNLGRFDVVFCCGLLYHLPEPWNVVGQVRRVSHNLFLSTHYASKEMATTTAHGLRGYPHPEGGFFDPKSGLSPGSFWPTFESLKIMLNQYDFTNIEVLQDNPKHPNGPTVALVARA
jgi:SAM-dependent methyltransferase